MLILISQWSETVLRLFDFFMSIPEAYHNNITILCVSIGVVPLEISTLLNCMGRVRYEENPLEIPHRTNKTIPPPLRLAQ